VRSVTLKINATDFGGPKDGFDTLMLSSINWGDVNLYSGAKDIFNPHLANYGWDVTQINYSGPDTNNTLVRRLRNAVVDNRTHFQFTLRYRYLSAYTDSENHGISFNASNVKLIVTYFD